METLLVFASYLKFCVSSQQTTNVLAVITLYEAY